MVKTFHVKLHPRGKRWAWQIFLRNEAGVCTWSKWDVLTQETSIAALAKAKHTFTTEYAPLFGALGIQYVLEAETPTA